MDLPFWIAVAALLLAVWAVVVTLNHRKDYSLWVRLERESHDRIHREDELIAARLSAMEQYVEEMSHAPAIESDVPAWPILLTPPWDRPEVRSVSPDGGE